MPTTTCCDPNNPEVNFANYGYDKKGNPLYIEKNTCNVGEDDRAFMWDEENRLRFVDTRPSTPEVDGSAIYTYDAGGERIIKQLLSSEILDFKNGVTTTVDSANSITATIYPNGLISARLQYEPGDGYNGTYIIDYTKHYFAGTQRITGKLGEGSNFGAFNCSWLIIPFGNGGAPVNEKDKAMQALTTANAAVLALMQSKGITPPPGFGQNAGYFGNCVSSYTGPEENHVYWYHPDHLGSSSFITGIDGEVTQNIEYFPSGEVFLENHLNSYNTPYLYNSKELDDETGYYYYGARYYNPRVSLWLNVDPLASYDPMMNGEHYIDGEHNGGVYNSGNINPYIYTYQNPIRYIDPNGKQVDIYWFNAKKDKSLIQSAKKTINFPENTIQLDAHSNNNDGIAYKVNGETVDWIDNAEKFDKYMTLNSKEWKTSSPTAQVVIVYSCRIALEKDNSTTSILQDISKGSKDKIFIGATNYVWGGDGKNATYGKDSENKKDTTNPGVWKVIKNGVVITEFNADWQPNPRDARKAVRQYEKIKSYFNKANLRKQINESNKNSTRKPIDNLRVK
ncbi:RHS repeat domain-containing protein [Epilithonimonas hungarica]|uniref:RHS repeat-associated core domain-containing protein n=1 Tax=Epilithonimonas hungarica TaxID=454006 RepID=A0A1G7TNI6_9FLAO|nr:RHS repeat-associated core domain-containing protein [Epilithonimonas hungarica]SDG36584.1 RHS repeat-associated core domain-containing protein [Epilithonimonas hungarica]